MPTQASQEPRPDSELSVSTFVGKGPEVVSFFVGATSDREERLDDFTFNRDSTLMILAVSSSSRASMFFNA
jgi:DNA helicase HerA-like ATPase